jgi:hypothetical protein
MILLQLTLAGSYTKYPAFEGIADGTLDYGYKPKGTSPGISNLGYFTSIAISSSLALKLTS